MEKVESLQQKVSEHTYCFFGAVRGTHQSGRLVGIITDIYSESPDMSHKTFECQILSGLNNLYREGITFSDPEVWRLDKKEDAFSKRDYILQLYEAEQREMRRLNVETGECP